MSKEEKKKVEQPTAESTLAPQLGSDLDMLKRSKMDMRRLSKTGPIDKAWISYFLLLEPEEGGDFAQAFCYNYLNLAVSEDGWRVNKMIQMVAGAKGTPNVGDIMKKPGWVARHTTQRDWERKAREDGKTVVE